MQTNDNFIDSRFGKFTASEIYRLLVSGKKKEDLFGEGAITYINEKIAEVVTGETKGSAKTVATEWGGIEHETDAMKWFTLITGKAVHHYGANEYKFYPYKTIGGCSPDGKCLDENAIIQAKCPFVSANHIEYLLIKGGQKERQEWLKKNQKQYYAQCQFEIMCVTFDNGLPCEKCYFITYDPRAIEPAHRMVIIELTPDEEMQNDIAERIVCAATMVSDAIDQLSQLTI